ncbi:MAG: hypothetical protein NTW87_10105 [Planctomycetota bacterium]|nr:hypothetical protein [Planctomycetota bacterium]
MARPGKRYPPEVKEKILAAVKAARDASRPWTEAYKAAQGAGYEGTVANLQQMIMPELNEVGIEAALTLVPLCVEILADGKWHCLTEFVPRLQRKIMHEKATRALDWGRKKLTFDEKIRWGYYEIIRYAVSQVPGVEIRPSLDYSPQRRRGRRVK